MKKTLFVLLALSLIGSGCGMAALSELITPARLDKKSVEYVVDAGVADVNEYIGWQNLAKALRLKQDVDVAHQEIQLEIQQFMERDNLDYATCKDAVSKTVLKAQEQEQLLFGREGLLSLGLSLAGVGGLTGFLGLMRKRPGDVTPEELDVAMQEAGLEAGVKAEQIAEIVKGVQEFKDRLKEEADKPLDAVTVLDWMKIALDKYQSQDTKVEVATIKSTV